MKFSCPHCSQRLEAEPIRAGTEIGCPTSAPPLHIPAAGSAAGAAAPVRGKSRKLPLLVCAGIAFLFLGGTGWFLFANEGAGAKKLGALVPGGAGKRSGLVEVKVFPSEVNLATKQDRQSVVVQAIFADGVTKDVTSEASFAFGNKALVRFDKGVLYPASDGKTELQVKYEGRSLTVPVQ